MAVIRTGIGTQTTGGLTDLTRPAPTPPSGSGRIVTQTDARTGTVNGTSTSTGTIVATTARGGSVAGSSSNTSVTTGTSARHGTATGTSANTAVTTGTSARRGTVSGASTSTFTVTAPQVGGQAVSGVSVSTFTVTGSGRDSAPPATGGGGGGWVDLYPPEPERRTARAHGKTISTGWTIGRGHRHGAITGRNVLAKATVVACPHRAGVLIGLSTARSTVTGVAEVRRRQTPDERDVDELITLGVL